MLKCQLKRINNTIFPYIFIGLLVGIVTAKSSFLESIGWLNAYFNYANIDFNYTDSAQAWFGDYFAPTTLFFVLIAIFLFSALHRTVMGAVEKPPNSQEGVIYALENFGSLLAIVWLGLIIGIMGPAWYFEGFSSFIKFLVLAIYPIMFLIEVSMCIVFLHWEGMRKIPNYINGHKKWKWGTRIEGALVLCGALLMLTYHQKYDELIKTFGSLLISMF